MRYTTDQTAQPAATAAPDADPVIDLSLDDDPGPDVVAPDPDPDGVAPVVAPDDAAEDPETDETTPAGWKKKTGDVRDAATSWWGFVRQPTSVAEAWRRSDRMDARRIPDESNLLAAVWHFANRTERILLFAVLAVLTMLTGSLLWCMVKPTRRWGLYAVLFIVFVVVPVAGS